MKTHEKIRLIRELNRLSQESVAEQLNMSVGGYAKIERGETKINLVRLQQLAEIFKIDILEFLRSETNGLTLHINNEGEHIWHGSFSVYNSNNAEKIQLLEQELKHCQEMLRQKEIEIELLRKINKLENN